MKLSITRAQRTLLFFLSASGYVAWFAGVGSQLDAQGIVGQRVPSITIPAASPIPRVAEAIKRDPFSGAPAEPVAADAAASADGDVRPAEAASSKNALDSDSVPNISAGGVPPAVAAAPAMTLVVRATIVGKNSVAYVANGTEMDIVRMGDSLGDRRIRKIDIEGIAFDDGSRLDLASGYNATPAPILPKTKTITLTADQLRRLSASYNAQAAAVRPPVAAPTPIPPTAAPAAPETNALPTADQKGLIPGTNATPNANAPTAFPYPYPYPPPAAVPHR